MLVTVLMGCYIFHLTLHIQLKCVSLSVCAMASACLACRERMTSVSAEKTHF